MNRPKLGFAVALVAILAVALFLWDQERRGIPARHEERLRQKLREVEPAGGGLYPTKRVGR